MIDWSKELTATEKCMRELENQGLYNTVLYEQLHKRRLQIMTKKYGDLLRPKFSS